MDRNDRENPDRLKPIEEVFDSDPRHKFFIVYDEIKRNDRPLEINDLYLDLQEFILNPNVPEKVKTHFDTARNLYLYSWFVYRFYPVAELQAYASLEFALKEKFKKEKLKTPIGLRLLLNNALEKGWIRDEGIRHYHRIDKRRNEYKTLVQDVYDFEQERVNNQSTNEYVKILVDNLPSLRNTIAHGSSYLTNRVYLAFEICCDLINQLYP